MTTALKESSERPVSRLPPLKERGSREPCSKGALRSDVTALRMRLYFFSVSLGRGPIKGLSGAHGGGFSGKSAVSVGSGVFSGGKGGGLVGTGVRVSGGVGGNWSSAMAIYILIHTGLN